MNVEHRIRVALLANKLQKDILFANRIGVNVVNIKGKQKFDASKMTVRKADRLE